LWRLVAGLSPRRAGPDLGRVHVGFAVDKVALRQVFLRILRLSPTSFIPAMSQTHFHVHVDFTRTDGRGLRSLKTQRCLGNRGASDRPVVSLFQPSKGQTNVGSMCTVSSRKDGILLWVSFVGPYVVMLEHLGKMSQEFGIRALPMPMSCSIKRVFTVKAFISRLCQGVARRMRPSDGDFY
jgi:hypothetical protein